MSLVTLTGARLRERRIALGLRQGRLAAAAGISASYLNLIEHDRRSVPPDLLARLAGLLGIALEEFAEGRDTARLTELAAAAASVPEGEAELNRIEDFVGRFPGWAAVLRATFTRERQLQDRVVQLAERLSQDPVLQASVHDMLSAISAVRMTAEILSDGTGVDPDWQRRFTANLARDSARLADGAGALVAYLDRDALAEIDRASGGVGAAEAWLGARDWLLDELGAGAGAPTKTGTARRAAEAELPAEAARAVLSWIDHAEADAARVPLAALRDALGDDPDPDPLRLAARFGTDVATILRRWALLPEAQAGLVVADASGALLWRKPAPFFAPPRAGGSCALWPLFSALLRPGTPVRAMAEFDRRGARRFRVLAIAAQRFPDGLGGPELREATMLVVPARGPAAGEATLPLGLTCRTCARGSCPARREASILPAGL